MSTSHLPSYIPDYRIGTLEFETGLDESLAVQKQIASTQMLSCCICYGLMERPLYLPHCPHSICEPCAINNWMKNLFSSPQQVMPCPVCRVNVHSIYAFRQFSRMTENEKRWFRILEVMCPNECGTTLPLIEMRQHRIRFCDKRLVQCPNFSCTVVCAFKDLNPHFQKCDEICEISRCCCLPVSQSDKENHKCSQLRGRLSARATFDFIRDPNNPQRIFKKPASARFDTLNEYTTTIELNSFHEDIAGFALRHSAHQSRPRRPLPTFIYDVGDTIPPATNPVLRTNHIITNGPTSVHNNRDVPQSSIDILTPATSEEETVDADVSSDG